MIKDKLHTISDEDAQKVAEILLKTSQPFIYTFDKISRWTYDFREGCDVEESVNIFFDAKVKDEAHKQGGWKDRKVYVKLIESDRYHDHPYFTAHYKESEEAKPWSYFYISNYIEAIEFLQSKQLL